MTNPTNAVEKPATGCGCDGGLVMCDEAVRLAELARMECENRDDALRAYLNAQDDYLIAMLAYRAHVEATNG